MAHVKLANTNRRRNDDLEASPGYAPSGESIFSRHSAGSVPQVHFKRGPIKTAGRHTLAQQIAECENRIKFMEVELRLEGPSRRRDRLIRDLDIRYRFLTKLLIERDGAAS